jgi:hypothetical protein
MQVPNIQVQYTFMLKQWKFMYVCICMWEISKPICTPIFFNDYFDFIINGHHFDFFFQRVCEKGKNNGKGNECFERMFEN